MEWLVVYVAFGVFFAGFAEADGPGDWCLCLFLWPVILLHTLGATVGSYFK